MEDQAIQIRKVAFGGYHRGDVERVLSQRSSSPLHQEDALVQARAETDMLRLKLQQLQEQNDKLSRLLACRDETIEQLREEKIALQERLDKLDSAGQRAAASQDQLQKLRQQLQNLDTALERDSAALLGLSSDPS